jgi:hypothetical protein
MENVSIINDLDIPKQNNLVITMCSWLHSEVNESILSSPTNMKRTEALYRIKNNLFRIEALFTVNTKVDKKAVVQYLEGSDADVNQEAWCSKFIGSWEGLGGFKKCLLDITKNQVRKEIEMHSSKNENSEARRKGSWMRFYK